MCSKLRKRGLFSNKYARALKFLTLLKKRSSTYTNFISKYKNWCEVKMRSFLFITTLCLAYAVVNTLIIPSKTIFDSINQFSASLYKEVINTHNNNNIIISPLNAYAPLALLSYGVINETAKQIQKSLDFLANKDTIQMKFKNLFDSIKNVNNVTVQTHNYLRISDRDTIKDEFKQVMNGLISAFTSSFEDAADGLFLLNVMYLAGNFFHHFEKEKTENKTFYLDKKNQIKVQMMHTQGSFKYGEIPYIDAKFIELPYQNKNIKMIIVLPDEIEGLSKIEKNLKSLNQYLLSNLNVQKNMDLHLPKFKVDTAIDIANIISTLGMPKIFTDEANFSGIVSTKPVKVAKFHQIAFLKVDEGDNVKNSTSSHISTQDDFSKEDHVKFVVDRPFYFIIRSPEVILFQSRILKPLF